jgi:hypothetical protein
MCKTCVIDITNRNFAKLIDYLRRQEALDILHDIQIASQSLTVIKLAYTMTQIVNSLK